MLLQIEYELLGRKRLVSEPGWASVLAPATFCAGIAIHQVFPTQVAYGRHAERLFVLDALLDVGDRLHRPLRREVIKEDVERRYEYVQVLRVDDVDQEPQHDA